MERKILCSEISFKPKKILQISEYQVRKSCDKILKRQILYKKVILASLYKPFSRKTRSKLVIKVIG